MLYCSWVLVAMETHFHVFILKYQYFKYIYFPVMNSPVFPSLDDISCNINSEVRNKTLRIEFVNNLKKNQVSKVFILTWFIRPCLSSCQAKRKRSAYRPQKRVKRTASFWNSIDFDFSRTTISIFLFLRASRPNDDRGRSKKITSREKMRVEI